MTVFVQENEITLQTANHRLSEILHTSELSLTTGGARSLEDALWVWGIVGGKDVGKSTLINALAGGDVVDRGDDVGEGTYQPAAYLTAEDLPDLKARFADLAGMPITYHAQAPAAMRRLVLVDLPDFDSLYTRHSETVRRIAGVLDGIIWVTTPKKVGDLRAISEIRRVLKARANFVYVVNKMDWLLAQSARTPEEELCRVDAALRNQFADPDVEASGDRCFFVAAKHATRDAMLESMARSRDLPGTAALAESNGRLIEAVDKLLAGFAELRSTLTTAPTADAAEANKRANLLYQVRRQAHQLIEHHQPGAVLQRLDRAVSPEVLQELSERFLPAAYCETVVRRLNSDRDLFADWSARLFRQRVSSWPLLGIIAWPAVLLASFLAQVRSAVRGVSPGHADDPFRVDGLGLEERIGGLLDGIRARLGATVDKLRLELPAEADLTRRFRSEIQAVVEDQRSTIIESFLGRRAGFFGRSIRGFLPFLVLLWFPLIQPLLAGFLPVLAGDASLSLESLTVVVTALSGSQVLAGLSVSLLLLAALTAAVYSRAVRDTFAALELLQRTMSAAIGDPLRNSVAAEATRPIERTRQELGELTATLTRLAKAPRAQNTPNPPP